MQPFTYVSVTENGRAIQESTAHSRAKYLAGGTNLVDYMKLGVERPEHIIDINRLPLGKIERTPEGALLIGATVRNSDLAYNEHVLKDYPALSEALLSGASPQLRNAATTAGNMLQRTRCPYFRDVHAKCNKRVPGSGCDAIPGYNRMHAILGTSEKCIATHPSDMAVALMALDATIMLQSKVEDASTPIHEFYVAYGQDPAAETLLMPGELILTVMLPRVPWFARSGYLKVRDRASYEFALASCAVALDLDGESIRDIRVALGGVATKPWRAYAAEKVLRGARATDDNYRKAAETELAAAVPQRHNAFKVELCKRTIVRTLQTVAAKK